MVGMQGAPITGVEDFAGRFAAPQAPVGPTIWQLPSPLEADAHGLVGVGGDLDSTTLLAAYRRGLFPMPFRKRQVGWWSPDPRGIMPRNGMVVSRSLRQSARRFRVSADTVFTDVMRRCGDPRRPHGWINEHFITAYSRLHQLGYAHSVEVWLDDELVGGVYGVRISRFFAGESMFHTATDASKVALWALVQALDHAGVELFDVQWSTPHLASLGVVDVPRTEYLHRLAAATAR